MAGNLGLKNAISGAVSKVLTKFQKRGRCDLDNDTSNEDLVKCRQFLG